MGEVEVRWSGRFFCRTLVEAFQVHNRSGRSSCEGVEKEGQGCWVRNTIISEIRYQMHKDGKYGIEIRLFC